jgi:DNA-directed RNA polymerase subunit RPC12/RpoP
MATLQTEELSCPTCDAQLNPPEGEVKLLVVKCDYCGSKVRLRRQQPPPAPRAAPQAAQLQPIRITWQAEKVVSHALRWVLISVVLTLLIGAGVAWMVMSTAREAGDALRGAPSGAGAEQEYPIVCSGPMTMANATHRSSGVLIEARSGCKLDLTGSKLASQGVAIVAAGDAQLTFSNSEVSGAGDAALTLGGSATLTANNSTIRGGAVGVSAAGSAKATLRNCTISGTEAATKTEGSAGVDADDSNSLSP